MIGSRLGPYEITAKLGEGGMGAVYRATDTRLKREVAIKVLPAEFTADKERLARFEREAQLLAQLHHPNIASIFGLEESGGVRSLIMELVEGPTLAERLEAGPLPIEETLAVASQLALALEEAHEKGIIHRDLKPQNIKAPLEGKVKVLDFGLAKALDPLSAQRETLSQLVQSPTLTLGATQLGVILGTAGYMSPEQAKGMAVDKRADIWAFGVVLFEMLSGRRLFEGDSVTDTLAAVLRQQIDWSRLPAETPSAVRHLLARCLVRDRKQRLHDMSDARLELEEATGATLAGAPPPASFPVVERRARLLWPVMTLVSLVAAGAAILWGLGARSGDSAPESRSFVLSMALPADVRLASTGGAAGPVVVSPSGAQVAFCARRGAGPTQIWVRRLDGAEARPVTGTEGANHPFWSPDESSLGFFADQKLRRVAASGGPVTALTPVADPRGGAWSPDGTILFAPNYTGPLFRVPANGGEAREVTRLDTAAGEDTHRYPQFLPDGRHFLYLARTGWKGALWLGRIDSEERRLLATDTSNAVYSRGHLLLTRDGALLAQPFSLEQLATTGPARPLVDRLLYDERFSLGVFSASPGGVLAYQTGEEVRMSQLVWFDRSGRRLGTAGDKARASGSNCPPALSADATRVLTCRPNDAGTSNDIWSLDLARSTATPLTSSEADEARPFWSPDGAAIVYGSYDSEGAPARASIRRRGEEARVLLEDEALTSLLPQSMSPDGRFVVLATETLDDAGDLYLFEVNDSAGRPRPLLVGKPSYVDAQISPDGRWLVYVSDETERNEVYLMRFPEGGATLRVSRGGAVLPRFRGDGREIYFTDAENWLVASEIVIDASGEVAIGRQTRLFQIADTYAVSGDGSRFLVEESLAEGDVSPIIFHTGWERPAAERTP